MMIVDKILDWARGRGYTAVYGSAEQVNGILNETPFASSKDATAVIMHLVTDSSTVDGKDTAVAAVYFASLCDLDFDGEDLLPEQERLKNIGKELLNDIRTGNEMTYSDPRWQYGYDDYAENVCWVCLRVTLTASAADCVPLSPEPPTPPPGPEYDIFCPQVIKPSYAERGKPNPAYLGGNYTVTVAVVNYQSLPRYVTWFDETWPSMQLLSLVELITEAKITMWKKGMTMTQETEDWLRERIGRTLVTYTFTSLSQGKEFVSVSFGAKNYETKKITVVQ